MINEFLAFLGNFVHSGLYRLTITTFARRWFRFGAWSWLTRHWTFGLLVILSEIHVKGGELGLCLVSLAGISKFGLQNESRGLCVSEAICLFKNIPLNACNPFAWPTSASWAYNWSRSLRLFCWFVWCRSAERLDAICLRSALQFFATLSPLAR